MVIVETRVFTRRVSAILEEEEYHRIQVALSAQPDLGVLIPGGGGLRKLRWTSRGRGKRGGARIIYYWAVEQNRIVMLFIFAKNERDDLSPGQVKSLRRIVEEEYP